MCGSWGKGSHLGSRGARPARRGKRRAVGFRQWRRIDVVRWLKTQETGSPHLQKTIMHRVSVIVHCVAVHYNHNRNRVLLCYLFQENKSFGTNTICIHPLMYGKLCRAQGHVGLNAQPIHGLVELCKL